MLVMENAIVSIIIPCYNGQKYLEQFLESINNQMYKKLEIIFVNDGSIDMTENIFKKWMKLNISQYKIKYIYQKNAGQAKAVSNALKHVTGEFLMWCDCDDILLEGNIQEKINVFRQHPNIDLVFTACANIDDKSNKQISIYRRERSLDSFFVDLILEKNVHYCPALYMVRSSTFFNLYPEKEIFCNRGGQNWQMLLPISSLGNVFYIDKILVNYNVSQASHSKSIKTIEAVLNRMDEHQEILLNVIGKMKLYNKNYYINMVNQKYYRTKFIYSIKFDDLAKTKLYLKGINENKIKYYFVYLAYRLNLFKILYRFKLFIGGLK